ncbi:hypothetical protein [Limimaricola cinnabarinus]|uniref:hypothetical protein n=1 Tax=Limimaricola cinnabarinus TaxID=1125964 RepID=UPI002FE3874B
MHDEAGLDLLFRKEGMAFQMVPNGGKITERAVANLRRLRQKLTATGRGLSPSLKTRA